ncbi:rhomboid family intramembrane serine protease [Clostridium botulinum]|uniref:rhomboid family intramembrane serine protease n=1 Tax=Clostridium botulinum TaxID=1491 RepID=UPI000A68A84D|nr:rhomboid family intramembrane serine protease [Clostridium botulinum]
MKNNIIKYIINELNKHTECNIEEFNSKNNEKNFWGISKTFGKLTEYIVFLRGSEFNSLDTKFIYNKNLDIILTTVLIVNEDNDKCNWNVIAENYKNNIIVISEKKNTVLYFCKNTVTLASQIQYILENMKKSKSIKDKIFNSKITTALIIINIITYIITAILSKNILDSDIRVLIFLGAKENTLIASGQYYRLITCMFLHGGLMHLILNMYALKALGPMIEKSYGKMKYVIIYLVGGLISSISSYIFSNGVSIGASGAIFSLLGAILVLTIKMRSVAGKDVIKNVVSVIVINIFIGLAIPNIDNFAHIGGLLGGVFLSIILNTKINKR